LPDSIGDFGHLELCRDEESARNTQIRFREIFFYQERENWMTACPLPCQQTFFSVKMSQFHKVRKILFSKNVVLYQSYESVASLGALLVVNLG
jgi:hypothetical protein